MERRQQYHSSGTLAAFYVMWFDTASSNAGPATDNGAIQRIVVF